MNKTEKLIAQLKKDFVFIDKFFRNAGIKKPLVLSRPILKTKKFKITPKDKRL